MLKSRHIALAAVVLAATILPISAQNSKTIERSATSTVKTETDKDGNKIVKTVNRRFTVTDVYPEGGEDRQSLLLLEEFNIERNLNAEGEQGTVKVEAWIGPELSPTKPIWTFTQEGDTGALADRFYKVTRYGCCGALNSDIYFNLQTGKKVFSSTSELGQVSVPNAGNAYNRFVGFNAFTAALRIPEFEKDPQIVGILEYGSETELLSRIVVRVKTGESEPQAAVIKFRYQGKPVKEKTLDLWHADGKKAKTSLSNFSIVLDMEEAGNIVIPVMNDVPDLSRAVVPPKYAVSLAK